MYIILQITAGKTAPESFRYPDLAKPYYLVREYRAGSYPDETSPGFAVECTADSFIDCMNGIYQDDCRRIPLADVKM